MSNIVVYPSNPSINQKVVVGATTKLWDGEKWVNRSYGNHEERLQVDRQAIEALLKAYGKGLGGLFDLGFSYVDTNDVGVSSDGKFWEWKGTLPYTVPKGTDPSSTSNFKRWEFVTLDTLTADGVDETSSRKWFTPELNKALDAKLTKVNLSNVTTATNVTIASSAGTDTAIGLATNSKAGLLSPTEKTKLAGVAEGAQANSVESVNSRKGKVVLNKNDIGLGFADNTSDQDKPVSTAAKVAIDLVSKESSKGLLSLEGELTDAVELLTNKLNKVRILALAGL